MSYLNNTRLVFSGTFQADVSTVNNDVRHFDNALFKDEYQEFGTGTANGWFNPVGSGAFRLIDCRISSVHYADGSQVTTAQEDPAIGVSIAGANERVAAKIVDLDPQWQWASQIWGLEVFLTAADKQPLMRGKFVASAFRDLVSARVLYSGTDFGMSSAFQSVLEGVIWSGDSDKSRGLHELRMATAMDRLSVRLMTFAFNMQPTNPRFTLGKVCGVIGPYTVGEPKTFILGRRFVPDNADKSWNGVNYFTGAIDGPSSTLLLDLGNALQLLDVSGMANDIGALSIGVLRDATLAEKAAVTDATFESFGEIVYRDPNWLMSTSGIAGFKLDAAQRKTSSGAPLALVASQPDGTRLIAIRETLDGVFSRAEEFVQRIDSPGEGNLTIYAAQYGDPLPGAKVNLSALPAQSGWTGGGGTGPDDPKSPIPDACTPADGIAFPAVVTTDARGRADISIQAKLDYVSPRAYLDGQIYVINYAIEGEPNNAHAPLSEVIVIHARDRYAVPDKPSWIPDIAPLFTQYGNLYPIMSRRLVDLSDPDSVKRNLKALQLAFSLDIDDPNYMPVTRDLSSGKRIAIQRWLSRLASEDDPTFVGAPRRQKSFSAPSAVDARAIAAAAQPDATEGSHLLGGKTSFRRNLRGSLEVLKKD